MRRPADGLAEWDVDGVPFRHLDAYVGPRVPAGKERHNHPVRLVRYLVMVEPVALLDAP